VQQTRTFSVSNSAETKNQMLNWANQFNICCFMDSHNYYNKHQAQECLLAVDAIDSIALNAGADALHQAEAFVNKHKGHWLFGHLGYDLKNEIEQLHSKHANPIAFPDLFLFVPKIVLQWQNNSLIISSSFDDVDLIFEAIQNTQQTVAVNAASKNISFTPYLNKEAYLQKIGQLKNHLQRGDCFEINFCQSFFSAQTSIDPISTFQKLCVISPNPFACYYKMNQQHLLCASPERYLKKSGREIISQPIKGTWHRNNADEVADELLKQALFNSEKDRSENVMVVDLVRNDLSKICEEGSVHVEELYGIYSFPQVHQMISTIKGRLQNGLSFVDIIKATFPMGSMTGAPKKRVMELIEQYETTKRGIFSGAVGYINPEGDFDFNVVIRSLMYNADEQYLSYMVGGGITIYSDAEQEYEECLLKASAMLKALD
jgi:para-aminobenzoate synthetase component I